MGKTKGKGMRVLKDLYKYVGYQPMPINLAELELSAISKELPWMSVERLNRIPGPIAYEYDSFKQYMRDGSLEASCWKITNLCEVIISYLFSACLETKKKDYNSFFIENRPITRITDKISVLWKHFKELSKLIDAIDTVMKWRNRYGIGHGSLVQGNESYIKALTDLSKGLLENFEDLPGVLNHKRLSLHDSNGNKLVGVNYFNCLGKNKWDTRLFTFEPLVGTQVYKNPIRYFGFQLDAPDIYFFVCNFTKPKNPNRMYRNYSNNGVKYIDRYGKIIWSEEPKQLALLNPKECDMFLEEYKGNPLFSNLVIDAAEGYQELGMHKETKRWLDVFEQQNINNEMLRNRAYLTEYSRLSALGDYNNAENELNKMILTESYLEPTFVIQVKLVNSWFEAKRGNADKAVILCNEGIEKARNLLSKYPMFAYLRVLEFRKNKLYAVRNQVGRDSKTLKEECKGLFDEVWAIYDKSQNNKTLIDIIGFVSNLYSQYSREVMDDDATLTEEEKGAEKKRIMGIIDFGIKVRKRVFDKNPTDLWAIKGYAWSLHNKARQLMELYSNYKDAERYLLEARDIRQKEIDRKDLGLYEDIIKNLIDLFKARGCPPQKIQEVCNKINPYMDSLFLEGYTPRIQVIKERMDKVGLNCGDYR